MTDMITVNTQSSIRFDAGRQIIYFDPIKIDQEAHDADLIFITHNHSDHLDPESIRKIIKEEETFIVCPLELRDEIHEKTGVEHNNIMPMRPGNHMQINGFAVEAVHAYNIGKDFHKKEYKWLGYVITIKDVRYYICGDMDATPEAKAVQCDVVLVPVGGTYTMDPKEAAAFVNEIKPKVAIPTHYGSIVGTPEDGKHFADGVDKGIEVVLKLTF